MQKTLTDTRSVPMTEHHNPNPLRLGVLISGSGTNLQAIIDAIGRGELKAEIRLVISNRADAYGLERARQAGNPDAGP